MKHSHTTPTLQLLGVSAPQQNTVPRKEQEALQQEVAVQVGV
jgi:hypothetical protein